MSSWKGSAARAAQERAAAPERWCFPAAADGGGAGPAWGDGRGGSCPRGGLGASWGTELGRGFRCSLETARSRTFRGSAAPLRSVPLGGFAGGPGALCRRLPPAPVLREVLRGRRQVRFADVHGGGGSLRCPRGRAGPPSPPGLGASLASTGPPRDARGGLRGPAAAPPAAS